MFIKTIKIKNFKCFDAEKKSLNFNIPDGKTEGSGLNILVGENNSGKSTIFEAVNFLRDKADGDIKNKEADPNDDFFVEITFAGKIGKITSIIDNFSQKNKKEVFFKHIYKNKDETKEYFSLKRSSENTKEILLWNNKESKFENKSGIDAPLKKLFETNFVWSDTNPNTQASFGSTTICGSLLTEIMKKFEKTEQYTNFSSNFDETFNDKNSALQNELKNIEGKTQKILSEQFSNAKISFQFDKLNIDSFFKKIKIEVDDGINTPIEEKGDGMQRSIILALLQVYAEELVKHPENYNVVKPFFLFIDEPEICLHPKAQMKLFSAILQLSKTKQIFIATHSPYFFKNPSYKNIGLFLFTKDKHNKIKITSIQDNGCSILPWGPSWNEINYYAYNIPTVEFHNELYGYLHYRSKKDKFDWFDNYLKECKEITEKRDYIKENTTKNITLCTYIRHKIHHPENKKNPDFTDEELQESIQLLIQVIRELPPYTEM